MHESEKHVEWTSSWLIPLDHHRLWKLSSLTQSPAYLPNGKQRWCMKEQHYAQGKKIQTDCPVTMQLAHTSPIHSQYPRNQLADDDDMMVRNSGFYRRQAVDPEVPWWSKHRHIVGRKCFSLPRSLLCTQPPRLKSAWPKKTPKPCQLIYVARTSEEDDMHGLQPFMAEFPIAPKCKGHWPKNWTCLCNIFR